MDNIFQWDALKNMRQIKSYDGMFQAIRALTVEKKNNSKSESLGGSAPLIFTIFNLA